MNDTLHLDREGSESLIRFERLRSDRGWTHVDECGCDLLFIRVLFLALGDSRTDTIEKENTYTDESLNLEEQI
jgi:hypothetical protein